MIRRLEEFEGRKLVFGFADVALRWSKVQDWREGSRPGVKVVGYRREF